MSFFSSFFGGVLFLLIILGVLFAFGKLDDTFVFIKNLVGCLEVCMR